MPVCEHTTRAVYALAKSLFGLCRRRPGLSLACLLAAAISIQSAAAQSLADYRSPVNPVEEYLDAIDEIEADYGPYAEELSDMYLGLGQTLIDAGEYLKARDAFHRAVTVQRVNQGPQLRVDYSAVHCKFRNDRSTCLQLLRIETTVAQIRVLPAEHAVHKAAQRKQIGADIQCLAT